MTIKPGEGQNLTFVSEKEVTLEVVNSNGVIMPYSAYKGTDKLNRYKYTLVPGEAYSYIATYNTYYHISDDFKLEDVADSKIEVNFSDVSDWLADLSFGIGESSKYKNTIPLKTDFSSALHSYQVELVDTEYLTYVWATTTDNDVTIQAEYNQTFSTALYHNKLYKLEVDSGKSKGTQIKRLLMHKNPIENTVTLRLRKELDGITYFQDYLIDFHRTLTLQDISAKCDNSTVTLVQENGTVGFAPNITSYNITVSMAAQNFNLFFDRHTENTCYGEETVGYRVKVDGIDVTESGIITFVKDLH